MDLEELFWIIVLFLGISLVVIAKFYKQEKKEIAKENITPVKEQQSRVKQSKLSFFKYLYFVYFVRSKLRPASTMLFSMAFIWTVIFLYIACIQYYNPLLKFEEYQTDVGIVKKIKNYRKGSDFLWLEREDGSLKKYGIGIWKGDEELLSGRKIKIYYQNKWETFHFEDGIHIIEMDGKIVKGKRFIDDYEKLSEREKEELGDISFWIIWNIIFLLWMFYFNYKEKPIHRLNRIRKLHGKQMAM